MEMTIMYRHHQVMMIIPHHHHHRQKERKKEKKNHHHHHQGMGMMLKIWMNTSQIQHNNNSINRYHSHQCSRCPHPR